MFTTDELACTFRDEVADPLEGTADTPDSENLWKNREVYQYMTEAADAVASDTLGLFKVLELPVVAGEPLVSLPRSVLDIRHARLVSCNREVKEENTNAPTYSVDSDYGLRSTPSMFGHTGRPRVFVRDAERKALRLVPTPVENDTLELRCATKPGHDMLPGMPLPFLERRDQRLMLHYMKYLAYSKQDADALDLSRSQSFYAQYQAEALARNGEVARVRRAPGQIHMEW